MRFLHLFLIFVLVSPAATAEQPTESEKSSPTFLKSVWADFKEPFVTESRDILLTGAFLTGSLLATRNDTIDPFQDSVSTRKPLGDTAPFFQLMGEWVPNLTYSAGMLLHGWLGETKDSYRRAGTMMRAMIYAGTLTVALKVTVQQRRPPPSDNRRSFPSGHTTTAFAFASVVGTEHGWKWGVPAYTLATAAGFSRINDNKHFLHDVVMGAAIGTAYGVSISNKDRAPGQASEAVSLWVPLVDKDIVGVGWVASFE